MSVNNSTYTKLGEFQADTPDSCTHDPLPSYAPNVTPIDSLPGPFSSSATRLLLPLPLRTATSFEVRTYIASLLQHNASIFNLDTAEISHIANKWRYGTGTELVGYDKGTWQGNFGAEMGTLLYGAVIGAVMEERAITHSRSYRWNFIIMAAMTLIPVATRPLCLLVPDSKPGQHDGLILWYVGPVSVSSLAFLSAAGNMYYKWTVRRKYRNHPTSGHRGDYVRVVGDEDAVGLERMQTG